MKKRIELSEISEGMALPETSKIVAQENINLYAEASRDFNPIHIDQEFARKTPLGGTIAHGMLVLAYVSQMMTDVFGQSWLTGGRLNVRFKAPARPGDTITVESEILDARTSSNPKRCVARLQDVTRKQTGETVLEGVRIELYEL